MKLKDFFITLFLSIAMTTLISWYIIHLFMGNIK